MHQYRYSRVEDGLLVFIDSNSQATSRALVDHYVRCERRLTFLPVTKALHIGKNGRSARSAPSAHAPVPWGSSHA